MTLTPEDTACPCCRGAMAVVGHDSSERLDVIPAQFRVLVTRRPKLACRACDGVVVQAPAPARLIEGGPPTEALVAHVLVARYADHLPLYRQAQIMARQGVALERSTLAFWVGYAAAEIAPVVSRLREILLGSARVFADETTVPVLDPGRGRTKTGYSWTVARDDRPWAGLTRRLWSTATPRDVGRSTTTGCLAATAASCSATATPPTRSWPAPKLSGKNALFAGSDEGGANWAHVASLVEACKLNGVNPQAYLCELLTRLVGGWPQAHIDELMP